MSRSDPHACRFRAIPAAVSDWPQARQEWLAQYFEMMGVTSHMALTERPPLNVRITKETSATATLSRTSTTRRCRAST